jgi:hypothetical protein
VLNYIVTSNHIHLQVKNSSPNVIADSMQLIAGRTGQEYNQRKRRHGAFWEDRYVLRLYGKRNGVERVSLSNALNEAKRLNGLNDLNATVGRAPAHVAFFTLI